MNEITMQRAAEYDALFASTVSAPAPEMATPAHERARSGNRFVAMSALVLASVGLVGGLSGKGDSAEAMGTAASVSVEATDAPTTTEAATTTTEAAATTTTEAPTDITISEGKTMRIEKNIEKLSDDEVTYIYTNIVTGNQASKEVGKIEILKSDPEQSADNFYWDLRHNPQTLAFYATCLDQETPNYENCAEDSDEEGMKVLEDAGNLLVEINEMDLREKAVLAEETIAQFELMDFKGVQEHNGDYQTMRLKLENGKVVGFEQSTHAGRPNDARLHFTYVDKDGKIQEIVIRGCAQITKELPPPETPTTTTTPGTTTTIPEETTTTTTIPEETTTTTTIPEETTTTTTIPEETTTTTTIPEETTTTTTIPEETTTTTTIPVTTSTLHPPADGPPPAATQPPYPVEPTPGYDEGNAENVAETQNGDPTNLDPTPNGTETPDSQDGGVTIGGGDESVVSEPDEGAPDNPNYVPSGASPGTGEGTSNNANSEDAATPAAGGTPPAGSDPGFPG